tara:strand:+ start:158 stop:1270 length:1113 start_codon:yes stop_codon:yes gene_type:complete
MLQNKIYQNFFLEIIKSFFVILFGLSIIALTVRAVNFLELVVDSGYPITTYFEFSFLNLFGILPKFIPLSFLIALILFIVKHIQDSEFVILWTSGVKKIQIVNLFFYTSLIVLVFYLIFSTFLTPLALNKSRQLLGQDQLNSFLPTIRSQQFTDSFKGFTFIVEKKIGNEIQNIFLHDKSRNLKNLSTNISSNVDTTIIAQNGVVDKKKLILFNGQIISSKRDQSKSEIIKFDQINIDLSKLSTTTIKKSKVQETSTLELLKCFREKNIDLKTCHKLSEIIPNLNRRIVLPFYIPAIALICSLLLIRVKGKYFNSLSIFILSFLVLLFSELTIRYTGINDLIKTIFLFFPFFLLVLFYTFLNLKFLKEFK